MTASAARIAANRANAQRSTGPRTAEGKAASSRNALQHGSRATDDTILNAPGSPAATYLADFTAQFAPADPLETIHVRHLAILAARIDLLDQAIDTFPQLNQRRALIDHLQEQYDAHGLSANLRDQPQWSAALRRYDGCPATYPRDPEPSTDPDLAACTLVYSLTSPRYDTLLRHHSQAGRRFHATLHDLQHLQATRRRTRVPYPAPTTPNHSMAGVLAAKILHQTDPLSVPSDPPAAPPSPAPLDPSASGSSENDPNEPITLPSTSRSALPDVPGRPHDANEPNAVASPAISHTAARDAGQPAAAQATQSAPIEANPPATPPTGTATPDAGDTVNPLAGPQNTTNEANHTPAGNPENDALVATITRLLDALPPPSPSEPPLDSDALLAALGLTPTPSGSPIAQRYPDAVARARTASMPRTS